MDEVDATSNPDDLADLERRAAVLLREAAALLDGAGLLEVLRTALGQVVVVGSVGLNLMTWPDIDLYARLERDEGARFLAMLPQLHTRLEAHGYALIRISYRDYYRHPDQTALSGLYTGLRILPPAGNPTWKVDLWGWNEASFSAKLRQHEALATALASANRALILRLKEAAARRPSYRDTVTSLDIYAFVLADGGHTLADFDAFLVRRPGSGRARWPT